MKSNYLVLIFVALAAGLFLGSCNGGDEPQPTMPYENPGVFIGNEGAFQTGTGTVYFLKRDGDTMKTDIFQQANGRPLGNILSDIEIFDGNAYMVLNNAQKVEVASAKDFKSVGVIENLVFPSKFLGITGNKAYVSQWGNNGVEGSVEVIDLNTNSVISSIPTGKGASAMLRIGDLVFVANGGGYSYDSTLSVIDVNTDKVVRQIVVGYNPNSLVEDKNGKLWVLCGGNWKPDWSALQNKGSLIRLDPLSGTIELKLDFESEYATPKYLVKNKESDKLFYIYNGGIYTMLTSATSLDQNPLVVKSFYSIGLDPVSNYIFAGDPADYTSKGSVYRYKQDGTLIDSFVTGIIPATYYFN